MTMMIIAKRNSTGETDFIKSDVIKTKDLYLYVIISTIAETRVTAAVSLDTLCIATAVTHQSALTAFCHTVFHYLVFHSFYVTVYL